MAEKNAPKGTTKITEATEEPKKRGEDEAALMAPYRNMFDYVDPRRVKIVQTQSAGDLQERFGVGSVITVPDSEPIADAGKRFRFVALFFYPEWMVWSDPRDRRSPDILESTLDGRHPIARRARNPRMWRETYPGGPKGKTFRKQYVEHLCFLGILYQDSHPLEGIPLIIDFSRGSYAYGRNLIDACLGRRLQGKSPVPLWSQVYEMWTVERKEEVEPCWGIEFSVPDGETGFIRKEHVAWFRSRHDLYQERHKNRMLGRGKTDR